MPIIKEIGKVKDSIIRSKYLLRRNVPIILDESTSKTINCYAYSLGIMYNAAIYNPGFTEQLIYNGDNEKELMNKVKIDLNNLKIPYRIIYLDGKISLEENEYLVKVFYTPPNKILPRGDFHFVRQDKKTGKWFHKLGKRQPDIIQSDPGMEGPIPGSEPSEFSSWRGKIKEYVYNPVAYIAIKEI